jgi:hypothetical protein
MAYFTPPEGPALSIFHLGISLGYMIGAQGLFKTLAKRVAPLVKAAHLSIQESWANWIHVGPSRKSRITKP